jgi:HD-like signal output (HDOD) protein
MGEPVPTEVPLVERIEAEIRAGHVELPVLPEVAVRVREVIAADGPISAVADVVDREPAFAAALLRYANSVAFSGLRKIVDLRDAMTRLGMKAVGQIVLAIAAEQVFASPDPQDERILRTLWDHAITTAIASRRLATRGVSADLAFLGGLLHDAGKVVILRCVAGMHRRGEAPPVLAPNVLQEFFDALHCRVGDLFFDSWHIPSEIRDVVSRHHDARFDGPNELLIAIVAFADQIAAKLGASLHPDPARSLLDHPGALVLRMDDVKVASLLLDVEEDVARFGKGS